MERLSHTYFYFLIFFAVLLILAGLTVRLSVVAGRFVQRYRARENADDNGNYAGGFDILSSAGRHFPLRFSFIALLFVLFNAEFILLLPWATSLIPSGWAGFGTAVLFVALWAAGFFYKIKKGALEWK